MMPKRKSVIQQVIVLLAVLATLCSWPAVSGSLKGPAEKLVDERLQTESLFKTAESTPSTLTASKPIPEISDEQLTQFASDITIAIVQKSLAEGVETVSVAVISESIVAISKQLPAPLMKLFLLNPRGVIGWTARIVNKQISMDISKVDPLGFALGVFSEALVEYLRENWQEVDKVKLEFYVFMIRESTVVAALRGGTAGAIAAQAMVTGKTLFEVYQSSWEILKGRAASLEAEKMTLLGNRFLKLRTEFLAESDPKVQCGKLAEIATFLAGEGTVLIKDGTDLKLQIDKYVSALAQRSNITCDIEKLINTPKATETSTLTSCGSTLKERRALQAVELIKAALGGESFDKLCRLHDVCYGDCITDRARAECDNELLENAYDACESAQNKESCYGFAHLFFTAVRAEGKTPFEEARAECLFAPNYSDTHPLDDTTIKSMIISQLKDYIPIDLIGNYAGGTNGLVEEVEILEKSYEKEQLNAIGKAFLGEPKNYWGVVVRVKGHGQVGFNSMVAGMMSGDPNPS